MQRVLLAAILALPLFASCSTDCEELAAKICACEGTRSAQDACQRRATQQQDAHPPSTDDQSRCADLVDTCDCNALDTPEGKRNCGLAEPVPN